MGEKYQYKGLQGLANHKYAKPSELDTPHFLGLYQLALQLLTLVLCVVASVAAWQFVFTPWFIERHPDLQMMAPGWVHDYVYPFVRGEWIAGFFGLSLHNRIIERAIRFGPVTLKTVWFALWVPLLTTVVLSLAFSAAFAYTYKATVWYLLPTLAQVGVMFVYEAIRDAFFKYQPSTPSKGEIERSF